jgi:hypothetical protein
LHHRICIRTESMALLRVTYSRCGFHSLLKGPISLEKLTTDKQFEDAIRNQTPIIVYARNNEKIYGPGVMISYSDTEATVRKDKHNERRFLRSVNHFTISS